MSPSQEKKAAAANDEPSKVIMMSLPELYINRELSWLEFNARVLEEAQRQETALLERLKFLAIFTSNLDEFFMVRVAGLKKMEQEGIYQSESPDRLETNIVLDEIRRRTQELLQAQYRCLHETVFPALSQCDIKILNVSELNEEQRLSLDRYFEDEVSPVLTPLAFDPAHPFPFLSNQSLYLVVIPKMMDGKHTDGRTPVIGFVEVPSVIQRLIPVPGTEKDQMHYVTLESLIAANIHTLFYGFQVESCHSIRVTRNLDYHLLENKVVDLLMSIQKEVINREHQEVVRLEAEANLPENILSLLIERLGITASDVYQLPSPLYIKGLMDLYALPLPMLKDEPFNPRLPQLVAGTEDIFSVIAQKDMMVHHPFESFYAVTEFLTTAAHDPNVLAIKQTLYRTAGDSPIIDALITAAENGKQVTIVVELKARFDEKNNISWARRLERAGVNVVFGFVGLKTHAKTTLIVRREKAKLVRYVHISTGNYNSSTARHYTDISIFTADQNVGRDIAMLFNLITGFDVLTGSNHLREQGIAAKLSKIAVAPLNLRATFSQLIEEEIEHTKKTGAGFIEAKMNALVDRDIIDLLYKASQAGTKIRLVVRGICCLRPGIPGVSDNIEVTSIIDRFLEHSRIYHFGANGQSKVFIASSDMMPRNMDRRIEILLPVEDADLKHRLINEILKTYLNDNVQARTLKPDGQYQIRTPKAGEETVRAQERFIQMAREGGVPSMPYEIAVRQPLSKRGQRPVAKRRRKSSDASSA